MPNIDFGHNTTRTQADQIHVTYCEKIRPNRTFTLTGIRAYLNSSTYGADPRVYRVSDGARISSGARQYPGSGWVTFDVTDVTLQAGQDYMIGLHDCKENTYEQDVRTAGHKHVLSGGALEIILPDGGWYTASGDAYPATLVTTAREWNYGVVSLNNPPPPPGAFTSPTSGQVVRGDLLVDWGDAGADPDGDGTNYRLDLSTDNGASWKTLSGGTGASQLNWPFGQEAASAQAVLRVRQYDSFGAVSDWVYSPTFTINRLPAAPVVTSPNGGESVNTTATVEFTAGTDVDGNLRGHQVDLTTDGGVNWRNIVGGDGVLAAPATSFIYDFTNEPATTAARVRARAIDTIGEVSAWDESNANFTIEHNRAPSAPLLVSPVNGSAADLNAGFVLDWTPQDPDAGDSQSAYRLRRKVPGAAAYEFWNATTSAFQSTEVTNTSSTSQVTFAPGVWPNGTDYNFSVATRDSQGADGPYATDSTVTASTGPMVDVTAPTGTVTTTTRPVVSWTYADLENDPQQSYQVRVFDAQVYGATGFDPATATAAWESGVVNSATARDRQVEVDLVQGTQYRAYVQCVGGGQASAWAFEGFAINVTPPTAPVVVVTDEPARARVLVEVQGTDPGPTYDHTNSTFLVERSVDGGSRWRAVRGAERLAMDAAQFAAIYDYEQRLTIPVLYRASTVGDV
jgi:hypothetical protein